MVRQKKTSMFENAPISSAERKKRSSNPKRVLTTPQSNVRQSVQTSTPVNANQSLASGGVRQAPQPSFSTPVEPTQPEAGPSFAEPSFVDKAFDAAKGIFNYDVNTGRAPNEQIIGASPFAIIGPKGKGLVSAVKRIFTGKGKLPVGMMTGKGFADAGGKAASGVAGTIAQNTKVDAVTTKWLVKAAAVTGVSIGAISLLKEAIGTYPFAGFLKEEALQTMDFGVSSALRNDDIENAQIANDLHKETLNPDLWDRIKAGIPWANVMSSLEEFYSASVIKNDINQQIIDDLRIKIDNGETDADYYARIAATREYNKVSERQADAEYYAEIERQRQEAKAAERKADEEYWDSILAARPKKETARTEYDDAYWTEYYKTLQKSRDDNTPSKLNFGLL